MGLAGSEYGLFLKQLNAGHLDLALTYAASLKLNLADALEVCRLMARDGDERSPALRVGGWSGSGPRPERGCRRFSSRRRPSVAFGRSQTPNSPSRPSKPS